MQELTDIKSLTPAGLAEAVSDLGQPRFRTDQLIAWLYGRGATSFEDMTDQPAAFRRSLAERFFIGAPRVERRQVAHDGTRKYLIRFDDGETVEAVGLPGSADRLTVCFSSQAGCAMGCAFCATGQDGLSRSLTAGEMFDQVRIVAEDFGRRANNAVAMGQGEPFANYDATLTAMRLLNSPKGLGIGARHLTVSTCGVIPGILRLAEEPEQFTLAVSLHSAVQRTRNDLMPGTSRWPLRDLKAALVQYIDANGRRPTLEYAMISGVNDTNDQLDALLEFCSALLCHVNLIPMNSVRDTALQRAANDRVLMFSIALRRAGVEVSERVERGADIDAACGQLKRAAD